MSRLLIRSKAFTLVEILVVVVLIALLAAMAAPYVFSTSDLQVISAARTIASDLQYAQNTAITSQKPVTITFNSNTEYYVLTTKNVSNESVSLIHPINKTAYEVNFAAQKQFKNLDIVTVSFNGNQTVTFDVMGSPDNSGRITLQSGGIVYYVDVAGGTGKITVTSAGS